LAVVYADSEFNTSEVLAGVGIISSQMLGNLKSQPDLTAICTNFTSCPIRRNSYKWPTVPM